MYVLIVVSTCIRTRHVKNFSWTNTLAYFDPQSMTKTLFYMIDLGQYLF